MRRHAARLRFLSARRDAPSEVVLAASALLRGRGYQVDEVVPEDALVAVDEAPEPDVLWLHKSYSDLALAVAGGLHARGARLLNPWPAMALVRDKVTAAQVLAAAGLPAPRTWTTGDLAAAAPLLARHPLVVKPSRGWRGQGVAFVRTAAELAALPPLEGPVVVQALMPGAGEDLRVYVAGDRVFATRKPFASGSYAVPGRPVPVSPELEALALRAGRAFGLVLYGLDLVEGEGGPWIVDVNHFPGYKGCPGAAEAVADVIAAWADDGRAAPPPAVHLPAAAPAAAAAVGAAP